MVTIDGQTYNIPVSKLTRTADFLDSFAERTENGVLHRELIGVYFNYKLELGPSLNTAEYSRLWAKLTEPVEFHTVTVPADDTSSYTFTAYFSGVGDELLRQKGSRGFFKGLTVNFIAQSPARS